MISINSRGDFCHGVGGGYFNINNAPVCRGGAMGWIDDDTAALANGDDISYGLEWTASSYSLLTKKTARLSDPPTGSNTGFAGGGYAAWWWGPDSHQPPEVLALAGMWTNAPSFPGHMPLAGLIGMGPDGAIAYKPNYQSNGPTMIRELDGSEWQLTPNHAYDLQLLGNHCALFNDSVLGFTVIGIPMPQRLPGNTWFPHAFLLEGRWWFGCQNERAGVIAHPFDDPLHGYVIVQPGINAWPAFRALDYSTLICVWSNSLAEQAGQLTPRRFDLRTDPLVDIVQIPVPPNPPQPDPPRVPQVVVESWDALMKAGTPWKLDTTIKTNVDVNVVVTKDESDRLRVRAVNVAGSDQTGAIRQLTVVGPTPKPLPPRIMERYTVSMAIASADFVQTFDHLPTGCCINIPIQNVIYEGANQGPNTSQALIAGDVYRKAKEHGNPLVIEMGSVKPGDCQCVNALQNMEWAINVVREHGGEVACITQDEPLTANADGCHMSTQAVADYVAEFTHKTRELGVPVGLIEAWPHVPFDTVKEFLGYLQIRDALPVHWRADIYWDNTTDAKASKFIHDARQLAESLGITFGVYVNSTKDPIATDVEHRANLKTLAQRIYKIVPDVAHVVVAAWAFRTTGGLQDVPSNLTPDGLLASYGDVKTIFDQSSVPQPEPKPEDNVRFAKLIEWKDPAGTTLSLSVKEINDIGDGLSTLILPDFVENNVTLSNKVFSYQPTGKPGDGQKWWRDEGTKGAWERCKVNGNAATFRPAADDVTILFSLVGTL